MANVGTDALQQRQSSLVANSLSSDGQPAGPRQRLAARLSGVHPASHVFGCLHVDVALELVAHIVI